MLLLCLHCTCALPATPAVLRTDKPVLLAAGRADAQPPLTRIAFDATSAAELDEEYKVDDLLFTAMVRTMRDGSSFWRVPALLGVAGLVVKMSLILAFVGNYYVSRGPNLETWVGLFRDHTLYDAVGYCASLFLAPAYLLQKLVGSSEFRDSAVYLATLDQLQARKPNTLAFIGYRLIHFVRTNLVLPCFILANAGLIAYLSDFKNILSYTFGASLVLEVDELFYFLYTRLGGQVARTDATVRLGKQTQAMCDRVVQQKVFILTIAELVLVALMKTQVGNGLNLLWSLPFVSAALAVTYARACPGA